MTFANSKVADVFNALDEDVRTRILVLRDLIFETAADTPGVGTLEETLKWGQPSYLTPTSKSGTTIRIDHVKSAPGTIALYVHCQTSLIETYRDLYGDVLKFGSNRCILISPDDDMPLEILRHCITQALTYHLHKKVTRRTKT